jgi:hypothetical protein
MSAAVHRSHDTRDRALEKVSHLGIHEARTDHPVAGLEHVFARGPQTACRQGVYFMM